MSGRTFEPLQCQLGAVLPQLTDTQHKGPAVLGVLSGAVAVAASSSSVSLAFQNRVLHDTPTNASMFELNAGKSIVRRISSPRSGSRTPRP